MLTANSDKKAQGENAIQRRWETVIKEAGEGILQHFTTVMGKWADLCQLYVLREMAV